nr:MAG TPA: hypothetical protein [Caudoviricetes sp.]
MSDRKYVLYIDTANIRLFFVNLQILNELFK